MGLDEVIVTATKRAERLQDVSESISAFDADAIAMRGLQQIDDVAKYIPGLSLAQREPGGTTIVFRGVASSGIQFGAVSSSALYLDEQPITQSGRSPDPRFIDIERIEALRGPQGTLYGASSQSGTLRVITAKPDPSGFDAWAEAQVTDVQDGGTGYDVSAMVNIPLAEDRISLRLVGFAAEDAGYIDNVLVGTSQGGTFDNSDVVDEDVNSDRDDGRARGAALRLQRERRRDARRALPGPVGKRSQRHVAMPVGDLKQVRFEDESLDDAWYQAALTLNAGCPSATSWSRRPTSTAISTTRRTPPTTSSRSSRATTSIYDFGGDPRGFAHERRADRDHDLRGAAAVEQRRREPLVLARAASSTASEAGTRS